MRTANTSVEAFRSLSVARYLQPKELEIMAVFMRTPGARLTRQMLSVEADMPLNGVCGRVRSLLDKKQLAVVGESVDPLTRKRQELLGLPVGQAELF